MYFLNIQYNIPCDLDPITWSIGDENDNGTFEMYSDRITKLTDIKDLISLDFLGKLSNYNITFCRCEEEKKKCDHCLSKCLPEQRPRKIKRRWDLQLKHKYKFMMDIFLSNQCGCEQPVYLEDIDNGKLRQYFIKRFTREKLEIQDHFIPSIKWSIEKRDTLPFDRLENYIYYNKHVFFDEKTFLEELFNARYTSETIITYLENLKPVTCIYGLSY